MPHHADYAYLIGCIKAEDVLGLSKEAGRMEKALRAGEIVAEDLFPNLARAPKNIKGIRGRLAKPSRAPDLAGLRKKRFMGMEAHVKSPGVQRTESHILTEPQQAIAGGTQPVGGRVQPGSIGAETGFHGVPEDMMTALQTPAPKTSQPKLLLHAGAPKGRQFTLPSLYQHEVSEARLWRQAEKAKDANPFASHLGSEPLLAERMHSVGDPQLQNFWDKLRNLHSEDKRVTQLMKEMGHTADRPMPMGGKQHRSLEKRIRELKDKNQFSTGTRAREYLDSGLGLMPKKSPKVQRAESAAHSKSERQYLPKNKQRQIERAESGAASRLDLMEADARQQIRKGKEPTRRLWRKLQKRFPKSKAQVKHERGAAQGRREAGEQRSLALAMNKGRPFESPEAAKAARKTCDAQQLEAGKAMHSGEVKDQVGPDFLQRMRGRT